MTLSTVAAFEGGLRFLAAPLSGGQWVLIGVMVLFWALVAAHVARQMSKTGRSGVAWFFITFFLTALPAAALSVHHRIRWILQKDEPRETARPFSKELVRCPHCGGLFSPDHDQPVVCPNCRMTIKGTDIA